MDKDIMDNNLFMMCRYLNSEALAPMPHGYHTRLIRPDELDSWMDMHFDDPATAEANRPMMTSFYRNVYARQGDLFYRSCLMLCGIDDKPIGTCFAWRSYGAIWTIHWFKVLKPYEGKGLGRALFSIVIDNIPNDEYPVYLHTQPGSFRAIKLYTDFGFDMITDDVIGFRQNQLTDSLSTLKTLMPVETFNKLRFSTAPENFLTACASFPIAEF